MKLPLWQPSEERKKRANMTKFIDLVNKRYGQKIDSYNELHQWSINNLPDFWGCMWEFCEIKASKPYDTIMTSAERMMDTRWFQGARLNFAENLLRYRDNRTALIFKGEAQQAVRMTYTELYDQTARLAKALRELGVKAGDRVAAFMPNMMETVIAMLASTSIGAIWSSCSPDFGIKGVLDRFGQTEPKVLFTANGYSYHGKAFDSLARVSSILKEIPSVQKVVVVPYTEKRADISHIPNSIHYQDFLSKEGGLEIQSLPPDHPLYIMYTSGTTGLPKCLVQGVAGVLINQLKELKLHTDVKREDTIFYFTTCGWMMWNWLVSSLALGATVLLFDGSAFYPDAGILWKLAQDEKITIFGTSARYLAEVERRGVKPGKEYDLSSLRAILSTGSPLPAESFEFVYRDIKQDVLLSSISGGSDINGCFLAGNPIGPVYARELQCRGLGMKVEVFDAEGNSITGQKGELVCTAPSPSMPLYFWNDANNQKYHDAYFNVYPNVWRHGDYIEITDTGAIVYGRSDSTLNPGGVRIGTAEIYRLVETIAEVEDSVVVGQNWENDVRVILFVKLAKGVELTEGLINKIKTTIRQNTSPRHVPAKVIAIDDIPYTLNMKKVELAVRNVIHNEPVHNIDALANPASLELYKDLKELQCPTVSHS
ncbi:MAG: Acetyl-coenzyme A synthetase [Syntrophomonadaceae bacterium]|nr:Acetyl-coenzyme A synthetase [Bacillota bacterium]MBT9146826.1 Acetyl-coenzyme A synthetase [Bacillota bacterium]